MKLLIAKTIIVAVLAMLTGVLAFMCYLAPILFAVFGAWIAFLWALEEVA